jgi:glycosyltransferase involved in cell wall biosynthesis
MEIFFFDNSKSLDNLNITGFDSNPGVGGSQFVLLQLFYELAKNFPDLKFTLITEQKVEIDNLPTNAVIKKELNFSSTDNLFVVTITQIEYLIEKKGNKEARCILWSHHPHDTTYLSRISNYFSDIDIVSIGIYQYLSNRLRFGKHFRILNLPPERMPNKIEHKDIKNFIFIGAFTRAKGLHIVLKNWSQIVGNIPEAKLNVLGGDIYQSRKYSKIISNDFNNYISEIHQIVDSMPLNIRNSIIFHGILNKNDKQTILKNSHIALLNPTGASEAYPASALECMSYSIPVIAMGDYGMRDIMEKFKELDLRYSNYSEIIKKILDGKINYSELQNKCFNFYLDYYNSKNKIINNWRDIFDKKLKSESISWNTLDIKIISRSLFSFIKYYIKNLINK